MSPLYVRSASPLSAIAVAMGVMLSWGNPAAAAEVSLSVTPQPSTPGGINSLAPNNQSNSVFYEYTITDGGSVSDTIPVRYCLIGQSGSWTSFTVRMAEVGQGGNLPGVTIPSDLLVTPTSPFSANGACITKNIAINTGALTLADPTLATTFAENINTSNIFLKNPSNLKVTLSGPDNIHIRVLVKPVEKNIACFVTDASGNFLTDCAGTQINKSASDDGRFAIVANKRNNVENATNPSQFYYNVLFHNPGSTPITVDVDFTRTGVNPHGTQALHAALFAPPFSGINPVDFDNVNEAIPEGADDQITGITIPAGWTMWADYHLEWNGLGSSVPAGCATDCAGANQPFHVTSTVTVTAGSIAGDSCDAGAWGYKK